MYGYVLQDYVTIRGTTTGTITQSEADWMSFQPYSDIVFFLDVKSVNLAGLTSITLDYETSPVKDDAIFAKMVTTTALTAATSRQDKVLLSQNPTVPLARWVRWKLTPTGSPTGEWGLCFRIFCAANGTHLLARSTRCCWMPPTVITRGMCLAPSSTRRVRRA